MSGENVGRADAFKVSRLRCRLWKSARVSHYLSIARPLIPARCDARLEVHFCPSRAPLPSRANRFRSATAPPSRRSATRGQPLFCLSHRLQVLLRAWPPPPKCLHDASKMSWKSTFHACIMRKNGIFHSKNSPYL